MQRLAWLLVAVAACGGSKQTPARMFAHGGGECPDPKGCSAQIDDQQHYALPDEEHPVPPEAGAPPAVSEEREMTCADVGEAMASIELGNYAEPEQRAPAVAKYEKLCRKHKLDKSERWCVAQSTDKPTVTWCAPRFQPGQAVAVIEPAACTALTEQMQAQIRMQPQQDQGLAMRQLAAVTESCETDRWTATFGECVKSVAYPAYANAYCGAAAPAPLRKKLADRIEAVR